MREIKFRAWDIKKQIFVPSGDIIFSDYGDTRITVNPNCIEYIGDSCYDYYEDSRFKVMQYTGLKDKNGVDIYEGDIVNIQGGAFYQGYWEVDEIFEITYDKTTFMLKNKDYKENFWIAENIYVIGNIYENKELLND